MASSSSSSKRKISDLLNNDEDEGRAVKPRLTSPAVLSLPTIPVSRTPTAVAFQQPLPLLTFSYTPARELEFTNSALRYFVDPPIGAKLGYGYDKWTRKPEVRGRVDSLVRAWSKARNGFNQNQSHKGAGPASGMEIGVVSWRGVMTKYVNSFHEEKTRVLREYPNTLMREDIDCALRGKRWLGIERYGCGRYDVS